MDLGAEYADDFKQVGWEENFSLIHILTYSKKYLTRKKVEIELTGLS